MATEAEFYKPIDAYKVRSTSGAWGNWTSASNPITAEVSYYEDSGGAYTESFVLLRVPSAETGSFFRIGVSVDITGFSAAGYFAADLYDADPATGSSGFISRLSEYKTAGYTGNIYFAFQNLNVDASKQLYVVLQCNWSRSSTSAMTVQFQMNPRVYAVGSFGNLAMGISPSTVGTGQPVTINFVNRLGNSLSLAFKKSSTTLYTTTATSDSIQVTPTQSWFETAGGTGTSMTVSVSASDQLGRTASGSFNLTQPELSIAITPATVGTGQPATISISNRSGQQIALTFKKGSIVLYSVTATSDSIQVTPTNAWFTTAGETGTQMTVSVSASDSVLGRTASGSFSLKQALTVVTVAPKNTTRTAESSMSYTWSVSGNTTQTSAELYINGNLITTVSGSNTYVYSSYRPPAGTVSWYVKVTNNLGIVSQSDTATFTIQYVSTSYLAPYNSKTSGSINRFASNTFMVQMFANGTPYTDYIVENPVFYWRQSGESTWNSVSMTRVYVDGRYKRATVSIAANTFPKGTIQWFAEAGDGQGNTRTTSTYNLSTVAVPITATPTAPIDTVETANTPTVFTWHNSGTITIYPAAAQLRYSEDNLNWTDFGSVTGSASTYTAAAGALPSGQLFWRVRVQNVDDVWGSWSDPATFSNFGAPSVSQVLADDKPFTTITWTSSTQQAYRITIDGSVVYGTYWGANVHAFTLPLPLADGAHTAAVEVQNEYGQWSQPAQTDFTVTNVPGAAVSLSRSVDIDAELYWSGGAGAGDFAVYRDGVQIACTGQQAFTDRLCLGEHEYFVLELLPGGYYTKSNVVTAEIFVTVPQIALLSGGPWIPMEKCLEISRRYTRKREKALTHYRGLTLPVVEWGSFWDESIELSVFYEYGQQADRFAALCGNTVVIKEPDGRMMVGALSELPEDAKAFHRFFTFTGDSVEWEDLADGTQS